MVERLMSNWWDGAYHNHATVEEVIQMKNEKSITLMMCESAKKLVEGDVADKSAEARRQVQGILKVTRYPISEQEGMRMYLHFFTKATDEYMKKKHPTIK